MVIEVNHNSFSPLASEFSSLQGIRKCEKWWYHSNSLSLTFAAVRTATPTRRLYFEATLSAALATARPVFPEAPVIKILTDMIKNLREMKILDWQQRNISSCTRMKQYSTQCLYLKAAITGFHSQIRLVRSERACQKASSSSYKGQMLLDGTCTLAIHQHAPNSVIARSAECVPKIPVAPTRGKYAAAWRTCTLASDSAICTDKVCLKMLIFGERSPSR